LQDIELARISQPASCQTSQPERQLGSSDELASERPDDNGQRQFPWPLIGHRQLVDVSVVAYERVFGF